MIERHIDYLQFSLKLSEKSLLDIAPKIIQPVRFYKRGYEDLDSVRFYFGNPNSDKALVVVSGEPLARMRSTDLTDAQILDRWLSRGANFTRVDLAVTDYIEDDFCTVQDVKQWIIDKLVTSSLIERGNKSLSELKVDGQDVLQTFYVGSMSQRARRGIFRTYDKGIQLGLDAEIITRLELEIRSDKAHSNAKRIAKNNDVAGNFRASFDVNSTQFERLMESPAITPVRGIGRGVSDEDEKMNKRWEWLINQVAPSLADAIKYDKTHNPQESRLVAFLSRSGLLQEIRSHAEGLVYRKYIDLMNDNEVSET